jgi:hypothetical protein
MQTPIQWAPRALSPGAQRQGREADHSRPSSAEVTNGRTIPNSIHYMPACLADSHNILNRWKNYFSQLLSVHRVSDVRQIEIHTAEPLVPF